MNVTGHLAMGASAYLLTSHFMPFLYNNSSATHWYLNLSLTLFGALLADIDHPTSTFGKRVRFISYPLSLIFGHRGITHSLIAIIALTYSAFQISKSQIGLEGSYLYLVIPIIVGYLSHLFADILTPSGVPLLYPNRRRFSIPIIRNGAVEFIVYSLSLILSIQLTQQV
jgi:inner membrane protein